MSTRPDLSFPPLTPAQSEQGARVAARLCEALAGAGGWLSFEDYLRIVLYEPGIGYYSAGGDFLETAYAEGQDYFFGINPKELPLGVHPVLGKQLVK